MTNSTLRRGVLCSDACVTELFFSPDTRIDYTFQEHLDLADTIYFSGAFEAVEIEVWCVETEVVLFGTAVGLVVARVPVGRPQGNVRIVDNPFPTGGKRMEV